MHGQNELIKHEYATTYLKSINNQLAALFNYAVRYYDLKDNPCRKAGSIGKSKADDMGFWTKQEFKQFIYSVYGQETGGENGIYASLLDRNAYRRIAGTYL